MPQINRITLERKTWVLGRKMGEGGFGRIHESEDENGVQAVIKLVPKARGAARELLFESIADHPNIIPIWDIGEWEDYYVLVMPRAEKSLRQYLDEKADADRKLPADEAVAILLDVAEALAGLERDVVHRDLKPQNILYYQGHWCLADFGIARYAEATTAPDTHKHFHTPLYAAPEQWRGEHATPAADIYAFGVTAFELLQGHRPFPGPNFREQHLNQTPPKMVGCKPAIASLVTECLYKLPETRPLPGNILARLRKSQASASPTAERLQTINQQVVAQQAQVGAAASAQKSTEERRRGLFNTARQSLEPIIESLLEQLLDAAPAATVTRLPNAIVQLRNASLTIGTPQPAPALSLAAFGSPPPFDVIAHTKIEVRMPPDRFQYEGRSHSLWFCDAHDEGVYRWFELAFMVGVFERRISAVNPFALSPTDENVAIAFSQQGTSRRQVAREPVPFDQGDEEQFIVRWLNWLADAATGTLRMPTQLPENSGGRHRKAR